MSPRCIAAFGTSVVLIAILGASSETDAARRRREPAATPAGPTTPTDKRDRVVAAPGTPFHGKAYWQAAAQCGGIYFKIGTIYSDGAAKAKVKPDPTAFTQLSASAATANRAATAFFEAAERILIADRKLGRDEAVLTYDALSTAAGDRAKTLEAAVQATKPCPDLYHACRAAFPQVCNDATVLTN